MQSFGLPYRFKGNFQNWKRNRSLVRSSFESQSIAKTFREKSHEMGKKNDLTFIYKYTLNSDVGLLWIGDPNTLLLGSSDPKVLIYLERSQQLLVTENRTSMPGHLQNHWDKGAQIWRLLGPVAKNIPNTRNSVETHIL